MTTGLSLANGNIVVDHTWLLAHSYTCVIEEVTADLYDSDFLTVDVDAKIGET
jgi:hypothetical protein